MLAQKKNTEKKTSSNESSEMLVIFFKLKHRKSRITKSAIILQIVFLFVLES